MSRVKLNASANVLGVVYTSVVSLVVLPLYLSYLGAEAYGLVGIFTLMQAWMQVLDLGLSPTLARQVAVARGKEGGFKEFITVLRNFEIIFFAISVCVVILIAAYSNWISESWINATVLNSEILSYCISIMGLLLGLRLFSSLYRSGLNGIEDQVRLNVIGAIVVSFKFFGALLLLAFFSNDIEHFFEYQLIIGLFEVVILMSRFYAVAPIKNLGYGLRFNMSSMQTIMPFASSVAYSAAIWILITQVDKLILSSVLTLAEFGYFSIVVLIAGAILALTAPIMQAVLPRMTALFSKGELIEMYLLYRKSSQIVAVLAVPITIIIALYSKQILFAWTGEQELAIWGAQTLSWFVMGYGLLALSAFQYYLQNAFGDLRLHVIGSTISAIVQIPLIYYAAINFGAEGVGITWFAIRLVWFLWWMPIVHHKFMPGEHLSWLFRDILPIIIIASISVLIMNYLVPLGEASGRIQILLSLAAVSFVALSASALAVTELKSLITAKIKK